MCEGGGKGELHEGSGGSDGGLCILGVTMLGECVKEAH